MAQIFTVTCPTCGGAFPCHPELWQAGFDLLCPFCGAMFPQEESPMIVTGSGEKRPGSAYAAGSPGPGRSPEGTPEANAESM